MAFNRFGKLSAASASSTQCPAGLRNLLRETWRTRSLLGLGLSVSMTAILHSLWVGANRGNPHSATQAKREKTHGHHPRQSGRRPTLASGQYPGPRLVIPPLAGASGIGEIARVKRQTTECRRKDQNNENYHAESAFGGAVLPVRAEGKKQWDDRIYSLAANFETLQRQPDKCIPADVLRRAQGIILLDRTRAGFVFAYQGGGGVALARDPKTGAWSPTALLKANEASLGFQIGAEQNFFVILLMNSNASRFLTDPSFEFGGEARGTAGDATAGASGTVSGSERPVLVYNIRLGLYGGAAIKAGAVTPDEESNRNYYGQFVTMKDILYDHKVQPTPAAAYLAAKISAYANPPPAHATR